MNASILPLNSLWLYTERGLGFRIFCGLGGRVGGLEMTDKRRKTNKTKDHIVWNYRKNMVQKQVLKIWL